MSSKIKEEKAPESVTPLVAAQRAVENAQARLNGAPDSKRARCQKDLERAQRQLRHLQK